MAEYITYPLETDPDVLVNDAYDYIKDKFPEWVPSEANFETWLLEAVSNMAADLRDIASAVPLAIFKYYGETIIGLPPIDAASASVDSTWTMVDNAGYTIEAGTLVGIPATGDELIAFEVSDDVTVDPGSTVTATGEVTLRAVETGADGSGLTGTPDLIDSLNFVQSIALEGTTAGGVDEEEDTDYVARLVDDLRLLAPRPILPNDFTIFAREIAGVHRATSVDGYNPGDSSYNNDKMIAIAVIDETGAACGSGIKAEVDADLQARREVNFIVNVMDPTYTDIDVNFAGKCYPEFDPQEVEDDAIAAVTSYLSPANWGVPTTQGSDPLAWYNDTKVRFLELAEVLNRVEGFWYITSLTVQGAGTDVTLTGAIPLPQPDAITGAVTVP